MFTRPPFVISIPQPGERQLTVTTPPLSETMFWNPTKAKVEGVWLVPSIDIAKGDGVPPPAGACIAICPPLSVVVNPVNSTLLGVYDVPSRDTARGCRVQLISFAPLIAIFVPA